MKRTRTSIFYVSTIGLFAALIYWFIVLGGKLEQGRKVNTTVQSKSQWEDFTDSLVHNLTHPLAVLLAQIVTIILAAKFFGWICRKIGQPTVVGEMIAGIVLGPSFLGMYFPEFSALLFPAKSLPNLQFLSQIGLIFFMFIVGMELDMKALRNQTRDAVIISHASIIIPFAMGMGLAYFLYQAFAPEGVGFLSFGLFMGIAMSITAFPVLARIVQERGIMKTRLGAMVITCAAADDITAWCILAAVIAIVKAGNFVSALYTIALSLAYVLLMIKVVKPFLTRISNIYPARESLTKPIIAIFFLTLLLSAYTTEVIGIHALFGAFMAGAIMPDNLKFRSLFIEKVEDVALVILLPLFFVFTGLRTQLGLLNDPGLWKLTALIILIAVAGKFLGSAVAAKIVGQSWKDSLAIGALMNTRGLMELVVLNIGYDLGVLSPEIFSMMVIMALGTTFMTGPALDFINRVFRSKQEQVAPAAPGPDQYRILFSFGKPESGKALLQLAHQFTRKLNGRAGLTALHLSPSDDLPHYNIEQYEEDCFKPVVEESLALNREVTTLFKSAATDIDSEIISVANNGDYDLLLIGPGQSIYEGSFLGKLLGFTTRIINPEKLLNTVTGKENIFNSSPFGESTQHIINKSHVPVGILIDKGFTRARHVFLPLFEARDIYLVTYAEKLVANANAAIVIQDRIGLINSDEALKERIRKMEEDAPGHISILKDRVIDRSLLKMQELVLISSESWKKLMDSKTVWLPDIPSTLIISEKKRG